jgi:Zn-dependent M28 family amino/carboxypeptidase
VVYGAHVDHVDHVGTGHPLDGDSIYNGADDNGSGSAALLAIARSLAALPDDARPKRSTAFVWFSGEELGLFGSSAYADQPAVPFTQTVANLNLDMVGRAPGDTVFLHDFEMGDLEAIGFGLAPEVGVTAMPIPWPEFRMLYYSDHLNFVANRVPAMFFFSGFHPEYHTPMDEADRIDYGTMERIARLAFRTGVALANDTARPVWKAPPYFLER